MNYYFKRTDLHLIIVDEMQRTLVVDLSDYVPETVREFLLQDLTPNFWAFHSEGEYKLLMSLMSEKVDVFPKYIKELAQEVDTIKLPDKLIPTKSYNTISDSIEKASEYCKWCYRLHKSLSTYQAQLEDEALNEEWKQLAAEMEFAIKSYEVHYNTKNPNSKVEYKLRMQVRPLQRDALDKDACISKAILTLECKQDGVSRICLNKTFGFRSPAEEAREFDWGLKMYREALFDVIASGLIFDQLNWDNRDAALATI